MPEGGASHWRRPSQPQARVPVKAPFTGAQQVVVTGSVLLPRALGPVIKLSGLCHLCRPLPHLPLELFLIFNLLNVRGVCFQPVEEHRDTTFLTDRAEQSLIKILNFLDEYALAYQYLFKYVAIFACHDLFLLESR